MAAGRGYRWLGEVANHIGIVLLLLGLVLGVTVTASILVFLGWKWAVVVVLGLIAVVVFEGAYRVWDESDRARSAALARAEVSREIARRHAEVQHTLQFQGLEFGLGEDVAADVRSLSVGIQFKNGGAQIIKYEIEDVTAAFAGEMGSAFYNRGGLVYPTQVSVFWTPVIRMKIDASLIGELSYVALYGHPDDALRYRSKRRMRVEAAIQTVMRDGKEEKLVAARWFNLEESETVNNDPAPLMPVAR